ncbi:MAG: hypothetical protein BWY63_00724 [Chloroflexi bacterium ADurb.Bin360]|nr:MAG: hypothetical protein BWY63_00724 [Chloroflexi bacterium ADurb.Bin360]
MLYLWPQTTGVTHLPAGFGLITQPAARRIAKGIREGRVFAIDNGSFSENFDPERFWRFVTRLLPYREQMLFVVPPDAVADAEATLTLFEEWAPRFRELYLPVAFVLQDGQEDLEWPQTGPELTDWLGEQDAVDPEDDAAYYAATQHWERESLGFDVLFVGGSTQYKLGPEAAACIAWAKRRGRWVHVGRVNSLTRFRYFQLLGADSCDGTFPCFEPDTAARRLTRAVAQPELFRLGGEPC